MHLILLALLVQTQPAPETPPPPVLKTLSKQLKIDGQFRLRFEYRDPTGYDTAVNVHEDDDLFLSRIRLNLTFAALDDVDVFLQIQDSREFGVEAGVASNEKNLDLHLGWIEARRLFGEPLTLRVGRQEFHYGDGRLLCPLDWNNVGRAADGIKARWDGGGWWVDLVYFVLKEGTGAEDDQDLWLIYAECLEVKDHEIDVYALGREFNNNAFTGENGVVGDLRDLTVGVRVKGRSGAVDYTAEAMRQTGDYAEDSVSAHAFAATLGYTFDMDWKPRLGVEITRGSGDSDPTDGERGTYDSIYAFGHLYQGFIDQFGFRNGQDLALYVKVSPRENLSLHADLHTFRLVEEKDAWYRADGSAVRRDSTGNADPAVGSEIDLHARWSPAKTVKCWGGVSLFKAGKFVEDTGSSPDMLWVFLQTVLEF